MAKGASSTSQSSTQNVDRSITSAADLLALQDTNLTLSDNAQVTIVTKDPGSAIAAIQAIESQSENVLSAVQSLSEQANTSAQIVAKSQEQFVEAASGQKSVIIAVAIVGGIVALIALPGILKQK